MPKSAHIELADGTRMAVLYEDRVVLALDKSPGWMLAPSDWRRTGRNLQAALESGIAGGAFWARVRSLRFLRFVHRLDADTSGVVLFAKNRGAVGALSRLFETRAVAKRYLAIVSGTPARATWHCQAPLAGELDEAGRIRVDARHGRPAETRFRVLGRRDDARLGTIALVEAWPLTGRTHQIRVHLAHASLPVLHDPLYASASPLPARPGKVPLARAVSESLALRAVSLRYRDPFQQRWVQIEAPVGDFLAAYGFLEDHDRQAAAPIEEGRSKDSAERPSVPATRRRAPSGREAL